MSKTPHQLAVAATQNTDRRVTFTLFERVILAGLIGNQTTDTLTRIMKRELTEDEKVALYSIRRKIKVDPGILAPYTRKFGGDTLVDQGLIQALPPEVDCTKALLDGMEMRLLGAFISGWLREEGKLADRDWAEPVLEKCKI